VRHVGEPKVGNVRSVESASLGQGRRSGDDHQLTRTPDMVMIMPDGY
jgi:hypothetical protein